VTVCAGTGQGKSTFVNEIAYNLAVNQNQKVAVISLEENNLRTARRFVGINLNHPLHIDKGDFTDEQIEEAFNATLGKGNIYFYDHFGSLDSTVLLNRIRHCVSSLDCSFIIFDHLSILVSGMDQAQDERRAIDSTMTKLRSLVEETNCGMILVSHLRRPSGDKGYEDGQQISLSGLRGSSAIGQLSDICLGLERSQQAEDNSECRIRVMKNRFTGWLGLCGSVKYYQKTGRMLPLDDNALATDEFIESDF
jgi:twinkle protein